MDGVTRVVICDDAPEARAFVRAVLAEDPRIEIVGEASDGATCVTTIALTDPDVLVLDLQMPRTDGFYVLETLRDRPGAPRVLVYSSATDSETRARVRAAGADFLPKGTTADQLAAAVRLLA